MPAFRGCFLVLFGQELITRFRMSLAEFPGESGGFVAFKVNSYTLSLD